MDEVAWDELPFGSSMCQYRTYAHCVQDVYLLSSSFQLAGLTTVGGDTVKLMFRTMKFLRLCDYSEEDLCSILAHATVYFQDVYQQCGKDMKAGETGNIMATLMFIAHCYVQDETCPLTVWHQHLFRKYCTLKILDSAVVSLMRMRNYHLRLSDENLNIRLEVLSLALNMSSTGDKAATTRRASRLCL